MITLVNKTTGESINVSKTTFNGENVVGKKVFTARFFNKYTMLTKVSETPEGYPVMVISDEWEVAKTERKPRTPKPATPATKPEAVPANEATPTEATPAQPDVVPAPTEEKPTEEKPAQKPRRGKRTTKPAADVVPTTEEQPATNTDTTPADVAPVPAATPTQSAVVDAFSALTPLFAGVEKNVVAAVFAKLQPVIDELKATAATHAQRVVVTTADGQEHNVEGVTCSDFADIVQDVNEGFAPYMFGAAGCGKSHTARQVADALGLDFYECSQLQFAHEVKGYGDAAGNFVPTPFYNAFTKGGILFLDEWDRTEVQCTTVLNTAMATGSFDFPVVGNKKAHPNFRVIAAGNTAMTGADLEYTAANVVDASSRDRFVFYRMQYDRRVELPVMANNDAELVDFMEDVRRAIDKTKVSMLASYRTTRYLEARKENKQAALRRGLFKGLDTDEVRMIYGALEHKENEWAVAVASMIK